MARLFWLSDEVWERIEPHLPHGQPGKPRVDDRRVISDILQVLKINRRWQDTPSACGPHTTSTAATTGDRSVGSGRVWSREVV